MSYVMVDIESDGPIPGDFSMICFGAVIVRGDLTEEFYGKTQPISEKRVPEALALSGFAREQTQAFDPPEKVRGDFATSAHSKGSPMFVSDNNGFDWQFINWYFHHFLERNPFGFSSTNLGSLYKGAVRDVFQNFKHLRKTKHTHQPVDDARGNAEAFMELAKTLDIKVRFD
jgi:hypothetical protein